MSNFPVRGDGRGRGLNFGESSTAWDFDVEVVELAEGTGWVDFLSCDVTGSPGDKENEMERVSDLF
jgi:hypothetical protein